jgi:hypothetical protein
VPFAASPRLMCEVSVGSRAPPPSWTSTLHTPQVPLPPQAEGMKILLAASVLRSVLPAGVTIAFSGSSLMVMVTSPDATSFDLASIRTSTSDDDHDGRRAATPRMTVSIVAPPRAGCRRRP